MGEEKSIVKNATLLLAADIAGKALSFFLIIAIARYLGDAGLGKYSFIFAFTGIFSIFADMGLTTYIIRELARNKENARKYAGNTLIIKLILAIATFLLPIITINFMEQDTEILHSVYIAAAATSILNFATTFTAILTAYEKIEYIALTNILERAATVGLALLLLKSGKGLTGITTAYLISYTAILIIIGTAALKKATAAELTPDKALCIKILKESAPFWLTTIFMTIYFRIDTVILQIMTNYEAVGWYNAAYKALDALYFIPSAIITALFPVMSRLHTENKKLLQTIYKKAFRYLIILAIPITTGTTLLADKIITLTYGNAFIQSTPALQILIWAEAAIFISSLTGYLLNATNKQTYFTITTAAAAIINVILNIALIPLIGYLGAAIATVATEIAVVTALYLQARKNGYTADLAKALPKPIIAAAAMASTITFLNHMPLLALIPIGAATYFSALWLIKGIGKEEAELIMGLAKKQ